MAYTTVAAVKGLLQIEPEVTDYDTEIEGCIASSDAMIDSWLTKNGLSMPTPVPKNLGCDNIFGCVAFQTKA